jgi:hypothetical protein
MSLGTNIATLFIITSHEIRMKKNYQPTMTASITRNRVFAAITSAAFSALSLAQAPATPPKIVQTTQCTTIKMCYCVNDEFLPLIDEKVKLLRATIAAERAKGKAIGYFSVPLSTTGGGYFNVNVEVSSLAKERIEERFG